MFPTYPIVLAVYCHRPLPKSAFVGNKRGNPLKQSAEHWVERTHTHAPDVDNFGKFVLDALEGTVYANDRQVIKLCMVKCWDVRQPCTGRTHVKFRQQQFLTFPVPTRAWMGT